jgi:uncharacterized protein (TIGR01777 family)
MAEMKRVLITGGSGLIGSALTRSLAGAGYEVVVLSRAPDRVTGLPAGARAVRWDGQATDGWRAELEGARAVVNLAGESIAGGRWTEARKRRIRESRSRATRAVSRAILQATDRPGVLLQGSAVGFYGAREGDDRVTEEAGAGGDFLADVTVDWEAASRPVEDAGVRRCLLRTGVVLSTEGGALPQMALPFKLFAGGPAGDGSQWVPWIHVRDEVRAIRFLLEADRAAGPFNLTAPEPVTNRELSRALGEALGRPSFLKAPGFALRLALGEMADVVLEGQRAVPERLLAAGFEFEFPNVRAALADLYR